MIHFPDKTADFRAEVTGLPDRAFDFREVIGSSDKPADFGTRSIDTVTATQYNGEYISEDFFEKF